MKREASCLQRCHKSNYGDQIDLSASHGARKSHFPLLQGYSYSYTSITQEIKQTTAPQVIQALVR